MTNVRDCCFCLHFLGVIQRNIDNYIVCPPNEDVNINSYRGNREVLMDRNGKDKDATSESHSNESSSDRSFTSLLGIQPSHFVADTEECVICLDIFSRDNPRVHTLCKCGANKAYFHYPCLLAWLDRRNTCPSCFSELFHEVMFFTALFYSTC
jgi:hypothetical protein